ncbi:hypothetical protein VaNZ11_008111, partial [Volvox africanus]
GVRGRSLTLKLKRRQAGAPQPAKFMGHGACDNISRSVTLSRFTDDPTDLRREAVGLLRALNIPPEELRGLGITVAKLDNDSASLTTRPSAPAAAKLQAPPRTAFDASKPPPWAAYFQRKAQHHQQDHHQQHQQQPQQPQSPALAEQSAARAASPPPGHLTTPTKLPSAVVHPDPIPAAAPPSTTGTGPSLAGTARTAAKGGTRPSVPTSSGTSAGSPGSPAPPPPLAAAAAAAAAAVQQTRWQQEPEQEEQGRQQRYKGQRPAVATAGPAGRPMLPPPRPAVSGTHGGGGSSGGIGLLVAGRPRPPAAPAVSSASAGISFSAASADAGAAAAAHVIESIDLSVDHAEGNEEEEEYAGGGNGQVVGGGAAVQHPILELVEADAETSVGGGGGGSQHTVLAAAALAARPAVSETTTVGCPAVSNSVASGSAAARWPTSFLRPTVGSSSAVRGGSSTSGRGRGGRGRAAAGSSGRRGNAAGRISRSGAAAATGGLGSSSGARDQGPTEAMALQIDRSVLAELPPDVRREVEREYGLLTVAPTKRPPPATAQGHVRPAKSARDATVAAVRVQHAPTSERHSSDGGVPCSSTRGRGSAVGHEHQTNTNPMDAEPPKDTGGQSCAGCGPGLSGPSEVAATTAAMPTSMADVDLAVLDELPAELRSEITAALLRPSAGPMAAVVAAGRDAYYGGLGATTPAAMTAAAPPPLVQGPADGRAAPVIPVPKTGGAIVTAHVPLLGTLTG